LGRVKVGIVFGGRSVEHEISLLSARSVLKNIDTDKYDVFPIFIEKTGTWRKAFLGNWLDNGTPEADKESFLSPSLNPKNPVFYEIRGNRIEREHKLDVIFPVLHGTYGEDGTVQGLLELMGIPFVGASVLGSSVGMDKIIMKTVFKETGLPVVRFFGLYFHEWKTNREEIKKTIVQEIGIPCFVKAANLGSSIGITKVKTEKQLDEAMEIAGSFSHRLIVEEAIENPREVEISVLGNENPIVSLPGEIVPNREFYDYRAKYIEDNTTLIIPANLDQGLLEKLKTYAIRAFKAIDCSGMGRVDFLIQRGTDKIFVSEINTIPGFTPVSMYPKLWEVSGITFTELISKLIELALERYRTRSRLNTDLAGKINNHL